MRSCEIRVLCALRIITREPCRGGEKCEERRGGRGEKRRGGRGEKGMEGGGEKGGVRREGWF